MTDETMIITPTTYQSDKRRKAIADEVLAANGITVTDVILMERHFDVWVVTLLDSDDDGTRNGYEHTVTVPA